MSAKFNEDLSVGRSDLFALRPEDVDATPSLNGRWMPHDEDSVQELADSYAIHGQLQPVLVRRDADRRPVLVAGFRRHAAALAYNKARPDSPMLLKCVLATASDEEALLRNIEENRQRRETTIIDDAHNHQRLRDKFGWKDSRIAEFYRISPGYLCQIKKLLGLGDDIKEQIHRGRITVSAALALVESPAEQQAELVAPLKLAAPKADFASEVEAIAPDLDEANIRRINRDIVAQVATTKRKGGDKTKQRTIKEVKALVEKLAGGEGESMDVRQGAATLLLVIRGECDDATSLAYLRDLLGGLPMAD